MTAPPSPPPSSIVPKKRPSQIAMLGNRLLDLIYPRGCIICGALLNQECRFYRQSHRPFRFDSFLLCSACRGRIRVEESKQCPQCGGLRYYRGGRMKTCTVCWNQKFHFKKVIALGEYLTPLSDEILLMKKDFLTVRTETFAQFLIAERADSLRAERVDCVIPVPMHMIRRTVRGVNSAERLADEIARFLKVPCYKDVVCRHRWTVRQATLPGYKRLANVKNAFKIRKRRGILPLLRNHTVAKKTVLLVDDVLTTGATCDEIARVLLEAGAKSVSVAVLARAEGGRHHIPLPDTDEGKS